MVEVSFPTLQRGNALRDALRHRSSPRRLFKIGRGASHNSRLTAPTRSGIAPASARSSV
ncbi:DUF1534 domain-containing protein [Pseudomonas syringae pv. maculicola str. ES4326]|uniref:DUF1534 domain-containing protein n=1 Tax=Pseudomonas syringae pv. maculicola str. ES4326 TaxID=629265 RepID=A0A8T8C9Z1_PSEYM|nr:DUF1534 domain-containing protein [Pseudomonas syringae pv. maculicola str. ES4326]